MRTDHKFLFHTVGGREQGLSPGRFQQVINLASYCACGGGDSSWWGGLLSSMCTQSEGEAKAGAIIRARCVDRSRLHSFNKYLMNFCYVSGMVLGTWDRA